MPKQFREGMFDSSKLEKFELKFEISKNRNCSSCIQLQLLQKAAYVLFHGLAIKSLQSLGFLGLVKMGSWALTEFLECFHFEFQMTLIRLNVFSGILDNFYIGRFWSAYAKFWERARLLQGGLGF
jgi:hypothetical protein